MVLPIREKRDVDLFKGRIDEMQKALASMLGAGTNLLIFGESGVGKTSFGWQLMQLLRRTPSPDFQHFTLNLPERPMRCIWFNATVSMLTVESMLAELLYQSPDKYSMSKILVEIYRNEEFRSQVLRSYSINALLAKIELSVKNEQNNDNNYFKRATDIARTEDTATKLFIDIVTEFKQRVDEDLIIFIDDINSMKDLKGLGSLIERVKGKVRFVLVGVFDNLASVLKDHGSVFRFMAHCEVKPLPEKNILGIFETASELTEGALTYTPDFLENAVACAAGYPWIAHHLGRHALGSGNYLNHPSVTLDKNDYIGAFRYIFEMRNGNYEATIDSKSKREILKAFLGKSEGMTISAIRKSVPTPFHRRIEQDVSALIAGSLLERNELSKEIKFKDGVTRVLVNAFFALSESDQSQKKRAYGEHLL